MISEEQAKEMLYRRNKTLEEFEKNPNLSDEELAIVLNNMGIKTSSSTVGRDLSREVVLKLFGEEMANKVSDARQANLLRGRSEGGLKSQELYGYSKDDNGEFMGSGMRR